MSTSTIVLGGAGGHRAGPLVRLYRGQTHFDFVRRRRWWFAASGLVILAGLISLGVRGLNYSIEFVGGTSWEVPAPGVTVAQAQSALSPLGFGGATITQLGAGSKASINVEAKLAKGSAGVSTDEATKIAGVLAALAHKPASAVSVENVGPTWGSDITHKAVEALIVFFFVIAAYISLFFEWKMALAALIAVAHDIIVTVGIYSLASFLVTPDTVVAFLTILGYSLYDTIVVFDRVRDNSPRARGDREALVHRRREPVDEPDAGPVHQHLPRRHPPHPRRAGARRRHPRRGDARVLRPRPFDRAHERGLLVDLHRLAPARHVQGARGALPAHPRAPRGAGHRHAAALSRGRRRRCLEHPGAGDRREAAPQPRSGARSAGDTAPELGQERRFRRGRRDRRRGMAAYEDEVGTGEVSAGGSGPGAAGAAGSAGTAKPPAQVARAAVPARRPPPRPRKKGRRR